jgi:hypothetical protein
MSGPLSLLAPRELPLPGIGPAVDPTRRLGVGDIHDLMAVGVTGRKGIGGVYHRRAILTLTSQLEIA